MKYQLQQRRRPRSSLSPIFDTGVQHRSDNQQASGAASKLRQTVANHLNNSTCNKTTTHNRMASNLIEAIQDSNLTNSDTEDGLAELYSNNTNNDDEQRLRSGSNLSQESKSTILDITTNGEEDEDNNNNEASNQGTNQTTQRIINDNDHRNAMSSCSDEHEELDINVDSDIEDNIAENRVRQEDDEEVDDGDMDEDDFLTDDLGEIANEFSPPVKRRTPRTTNTAHNIATLDNKHTIDKNKKLFPQKLWDLIHDQRYQHCLRWSLDGNRVFLNRNEFEIRYLKTPENQFHTQKAISFVRQMNMYGFKKVDDSYYENANFKRSKQHLLGNMIRRHPNKGLFMGLVAAASNSVNNTVHHQQQHQRLQLVLNSSQPSSTQRHQQQQNVRMTTSNSSPTPIIKGSNHITPGGRNHQQNLATVVANQRASVLANFAQQLQQTVTNQNHSTSHSNNQTGVANGIIQSSPLSLAPLTLLQAPHHKQELLSHKNRMSSFQQQQNDLEVQKQQSIRNKRAIKDLRSRSSSPYNKNTHMRGLDNDVDLNKEQQNQLQSRIKAMAAALNVAQQKLPGSNQQSLSGSALQQSLVQSLMQLNNHQIVPASSFLESLASLNSLASQTASATPKHTLLTDCHQRQQQQPQQNHKPNSIHFEALHSQQPTHLITKRHALLKGNSVSPTESSESPPSTTSSPDNSAANNRSRAYEQIFSKKCGDNLETSGEALNLATNNHILRGENFKRKSIDNQNFNQRKRVATECFEDSRSDSPDSANASQERERSPLTCAELAFELAAETSARDGLEIDTSALQNIALYVQRFLGLLLELARNEMDQDAMMDRKTTYSTVGSRNKTKPIHAASLAQALSMLAPQVLLGPIKCDSEA